MTTVITNGPSTSYVRRQLFLLLSYVKWPACRAQLPSRSRFVVLSWRLCPFVVCLSPVDGIRSADTNKLLMRRTKTDIEAREFGVSSATVWNSLPPQNTNIIMIRYYTIEEFNVDSKAEYTA